MSGTLHNHTRPSPTHGGKCVSESKWSTRSRYLDCIPRWLFLSFNHHCCLGDSRVFCHPRVTSHLLMMFIQASQGNPGQGPAKNCSRGNRSAFLSKIASPLTPASPECPKRNTQQAEIHQRCPVMRPQSSRPASRL